MTNIERRRKCGLFVQPDGLMFPESLTNSRNAGKGAWAALLAKAVLDVLPKGARHSYVPQRQSGSSRGPRAVEGFAGCTLEPRVVLQTLDGGHPVSMYIVRREVGRGDEKMVSRVHAQVGKVRVRTNGASFLTRGMIQFVLQIPGELGQPSALGRDPIMHY
jgi:hypothetical protein